MCSHLHTRKPCNGAVLLWTSWVLASLCRKGDGEVIVRMTLCLGVGPGHRV